MPHNRYQLYNLLTRHGPHKTKSRNRPAPVRLTRRNLVFITIPPTLLIHILHIIHTVGITDSMVPAGGNGYRGQGALGRVVTVVTIMPLRCHDPDNRYDQQESWNRDNYHNHSDYHHNRSDCDDYHNRSDCDDYYNVLTPITRRFHRIHLLCMIDIIITIITIVPIVMIGTIVTRNLRVLVTMVMIVMIVMMIVMIVMMIVIMIMGAVVGVVRNGRVILAVSNPTRGVYTSAALCARVV